VVLIELWMQGDIHQTLQTARATRLHRGYARDRLILELAVPNNPKPADALGHQHRSVREKRYRPGLFEMLRDDRDFELSLLSRFDADSTPW